MKRPISPRFALLIFLTASAPPVYSQTQSLLGLQLYAGVSVTGAVGTVQAIQYATNMAQPSWIPITNFTLIISPYLWVDTTVPATGKRFYRALGTIPTNMLLIPGGFSALIGNSFPSDANADADELPRHSVSNSPFYMDKYLVTKALWDQVLNVAAGLGYSYVNSGDSKAANHPVHSIDWFDAVKWCNARSQNEGRTPCYYSDQLLTAVYKTGEVATVFVKWDASGYRLPTEAEWERATRGISSPGNSNTNRFPWGDCITQSNANYYARPPGCIGGSYTYDCNQNCGYDTPYNNGIVPYTSPVGSFPANPLGLFDMAGNVYQWCWDWYDSVYYGSSPVNDPRGPITGTSRVLRGGSWSADAAEARCANRNSDDPSAATDQYGFRCVRGL